jgi:CheY-like chemotaxis protein
MASLSQPAPRGRSVLYVEDDPHDFFLLHVANHKCGAPFLLQRAEDGEQAIAYLAGMGPYENREKFPFPDLVLLDLRMPKLDGFEVLQWIRSNPGTANLPVVVLAGSGFRADMRRALELGANSCLTKPPVSEQLRLVIEQISALLNPLPLPITASRPADDLRA